MFFIYLALLTQFMDKIGKTKNIFKIKIVD